MIVIRTEQRHVLSAHDREGLVLAVRDHLRACFGDRLEPRDEEALHEALRVLIDRAVGLGVTSPRELCRLANLAATLGWGFLEQPDHAWMIDEVLADECLGTPAQRVALLVDRCLRTLEVREHNAAVWAGRTSSDGTRQSFDERDIL